MRIIKNKCYRHFKGMLYIVTGIAINTETDEYFVIYQALYGDGQIYARPYDMFISKAPQSPDNITNQIYRFEEFEATKVI